MESLRWRAGVRIRTNFKIREGAGALEIPIDDHERDEAGTGDPFGLEQAKAHTLVASAICARRITVS